MDFGSSLKDIRDALGLTQDELAQKLSTTKQVISRYERHEREPKAGVIHEWAKKLEIPEACLAGLPIPQGFLDSYSNRIDAYRAFEAAKWSEMMDARVSKTVSDDDIRFALSNGDQPITDAQFEEVKKFVEFIKTRDKK